MPWRLRILGGARAIGRAIGLAVGLAVGGVSPDAKAALYQCTDLSGSLVFSDSAAQLQDCMPYTLVMQPAVLTPAASSSELIKEAELVKGGEPMKGAEPFGRGPAGSLPPDPGAAAPVETGLLTAPTAERAAAIGEGGVGGVMVPGEP